MQAFLKFYKEDFETFSDQSITQNVNNSFLFAFYFLCVQNILVMMSLEYWKENLPVGISGENRNELDGNSHLSWEASEPILKYLSQAFYSNKIGMKWKNISNISRIELKSKVRAMFTRDTD